MSPASPSYPPAERSRSRHSHSRGSLPVLIGALSIVVWGTFAFGAVYEWAYIPLAAAAAGLGLFGLWRGDRPVIVTNRLLWIGIGGLALLALLQQLPLPRPWLERLSPATVRFLASYDLGFTFNPDVAVGGLASTPRHAMSIAPGATRLGLLLLCALALLLAGLLRSLSRTTAGRMSKGLVVIGCLLALVGIIQKAMLGEIAYTGMKIYGLWTPESLLTSPFGPFVNKNHFGGWMLMVVPLSLALAMDAFEREGRARGGLRRWLVWLSSPGGGRVLMFASAGLLMIVSTLMTRSRSAMACLALITLFAAAAVWRRTRSGRVAAGVALGFGTLLLAGALYVGSDAEIGRFVTETNSAQLRIAIWTVAVDVVRKFPLFGSGLDTFGVATVFYQKPGAAHFREAHNDYLQVLVECGLVGAALMLTALAGVWLGARRRFSEDREAESYWPRVGAVIGLLAIGVQSTMEFSLQLPGNSAVFVLLLALALYKPAARQSSSTRFDA